MCTAAAALMPIADAIMAPLPTDYICPRQQRKFNTQFSPQSSPILWLLQLEQERRRREAEALAVQTPEAAAAAAAVRARAELLLREQRDEVKRMNQMVLYSKCAVERDAQVSAAKVMPTLTYERDIGARTSPPLFGNTSIRWRSDPSSTCNPCTRSASAS